MIIYNKKIKIKKIRKKETKENARQKPKPFCLYQGPDDTTRRVY